MPRILNHRDTQQGLYVGRMSSLDEHYGNPFTHQGTRTLAMVRVPTRDDAVNAYAAWLRGDEYFKCADGTLVAELRRVEPTRRDWILRNVRRLKGHNLRCWCAPKRCHAEVLMDLANREEM